MTKISQSSLLLTIILCTVGSWTVSATLRGAEEGPPASILEETHTRFLGTSVNCETLLREKGYGEAAKAFAADVYYRIDVDFPTTQYCQGYKMDEIRSTAQRYLGALASTSEWYANNEVGDSGFDAKGADASSDVCGSVADSQIVVKAGGDLRLCYIESDEVTNPANSVGAGTAEKEKLESIKQKIAQLIEDHDMENFQLQQDVELLERELKLETVKLNAKLTTEKKTRKVDLRRLQAQLGKEMAKLARDDTKSMKEVDELEVKQKGEVAKELDDDAKKDVEAAKKKTELATKQQKSRDEMALKRAEIHQIQLNARQSIENTKTELEKEIKEIEMNGEKEMPEFIKHDSEFVLEATRYYMEYWMRRNLVNRRRYRNSCWDYGRRTISVKVVPIDATEYTAPNCT